MKYNNIKIILCILLSFPGYAVAKAEGPVINNGVYAQDTLVGIAYRKIAKEDMPVGISNIDIEELTKKNYNTYTNDNMQGYIGGWNGNSLWGMDDILVLVDGVPRSVNNVLPTEVKEMTFLKGASAVVLYGSRAAKGVILITTKRGSAGDLKVSVRANTGFNVAKNYTDYLGSAEYMTLYNEARQNDGLSALYSENDIYNYASGNNPFRYADVNFYSSDYIKKYSNRTDATAEISGGNDKARYYANISYYNIGDVFKFGEAKNNYSDRLNFRGNVDFAISNSISAYVNANVSFYNSRSANGGSYWETAGTFRPNRVSPLVPLSSLDGNALSALDLVGNSNNIVDGKYFLGGTQSDETNIFADYYAAGYNKYTARQFQFDAGIDFDLKSIMKGLSFKTMMAVDYATGYTTSYNNEYATYRPEWSNHGGSDVIVGVTKYNIDKKSGVQNISGSSDNQTITFNGGFYYDNSFEDVHNVSAILLANGYQQSFSSTYHKTSNANLGLQLGYNYDHRYFVDFSGAVVHSSKLAPGHRRAFSPSLTLGWNLKGESFLEDNSIISDLMISGSASKLNTDLGIDDYYMYQTSYNQSDGAWWGWRESVSIHSTNSVRGGNEDLNFIQRKEIAANVKAGFFNRAITADVSFFMNTIEGKLITPTNLYPNYFFTYYPEASFLPRINFDNDLRKGIDFSVNFNKKTSNAEFSLGICGTYYDTEATKRSENYADDYQYREGKPVDGIWGLRADGFFNSQEEIDNSPEQKFGGTVKPGDLKYIDQNGDGVIDNKDQVYLGKGGWYGSPLTLGVNLTAKYKGFTFFVLGTGNFGGNAIKSNDYFWVSGDKKYSGIVRDRWTEETKETAKYPRLTTENGANNFQNSDFWLYKTDAFRIAKVQITYDFSEKLLKNSFVNGLSAYVSGSNLLTISKEREVLEMSVKSAPQTRFYNVGIKATF